jgi:hypothetical protein
MRRKPIDAVQGAGRRDDVHTTGAGLGERLGARGHRRAAGQDVVHEQDALRNVTPAGRERTVHGDPSLLTPAASLGPRRHTSDQEPRHWQVQPMTERHRERPRLVVAALGEATAREGNPRHDLGDRRLVTGGDRVGERARDVAPPRELQPVHSPTSRPVIEEGRSGARHRLWWTVAARSDRDRRRAAAPRTPRRNQRNQPVATAVAERPGPRAAPGAPPGEHDVERTADHGRTVPRRADTPTAARPRRQPRPEPRSTGAPAREAPGTRRPFRAPIPRRDRPRAPGGGSRRP